MATNKAPFSLFAASGAVCIVLLVIAMLQIVQAPQDAIQGIHQKIFYMHVSAAWTAYLLIAVMAVASIIVLFSGENRLPQALTAARLAAAATESALVFLTIVNVTGPLWGKPIWGTWWSWDARLTTNFVLWLLLAVYTLLRFNLPDDFRSSKIFAVLGLLASVNVPIVHYSVRWWRTLHPAPVVMQEKVGGGLDPAMVPPLLWTLAAFTVLGLMFCVVGYRLAVLRARTIESGNLL